MRKWLKENWLFLITLIIDIILVVGFFMFYCKYNPNWQTDASFFRTLGYLFLAPFVVYGAYIAGNRWKNDSKKLENDREQLYNTIFSGAIAHLGHEQKSVRMGGVYTLLELAQKNSEYKKKIFEVLNYHIVSQTNQDFENHQKTQAKENQEEKEKHKTSTEVQNILNLLFMNKENVKWFKDLGLEANLMGADLQGAFLSKAYLKGANIVNINLQGVYLTDSNLQETFLMGANLQNADLENANLQRARIWGAIMPNNFIEQIEYNYDLKLKPLPKNEIKQNGKYGVILAVANDVDVDEFIKLDSQDLSALTEEFINQEGINFYKVTDIL